MNKERELLQWKNRRELLMELQGSLAEIFPEEDYNVVIFGSFITNDFKPDSDVDAVVYCQNTERQYVIARYVECFFEDIGISSDILQYHYDSSAVIYYRAFMSGIKLTDYYPRELKAQLYLLWKEYDKRQMELRDYRRYQRWYIKIRRKKAMERMGE